MRSLRFICCLFPLSVWAQVTVDRPIHLLGTNDGDRQVLGLPPHVAPTAVLGATVEVSGQHRLSSTVASSGTWFATLPSLTGALTPGTNILVATPAPNNAPVLLALNDQPEIPVLIAPGVALTGDAYPEGTLLSLVFDGSAFQLMNGRANARRPCPADMVAVNADHCIEPNERPASNFFNAALACGTADRRLCSWGELVAACLSAAQLGLNDVVGNWEWTRDSANEDGSVRVGFQTSCQAATTRAATDTSLPITSRCCYSR